MKKLLALAIAAGIVFSAAVYAADANGTAAPSMKASEDFASITADNTLEQSRVLGSVDPKSGFKFQLELTNTGAGVKEATLTNWTTRGKDKKPLVIMQSAFMANEASFIPMANGLFVFLDRGVQIRLNALNWQAGEVITGKDGAQSASFTAIIKRDHDTSVLKIVKTYTVRPGSDEFECGITTENLTDKPFTTQYELLGPGGIGREDVRPDAFAVGGFAGPEGAIEVVKLAGEALKKTPSTTLVHKNAGFKLIWSAMTNKYFAAIIRPVPENSTLVPGFVGSVEGVAVNLKDGARLRDKNPDDHDSSAIDLHINSGTLTAAGSPDSKQHFSFQVYLGPKDKDLFENNPLYRQLGYYHTIDFNACCSLGIFDTLSLAILALMKWMHLIIPNYGWVIIILVLLVRLALHPITKSSQVSMMKMGKLGPMAEEIKQKYADNKQEMNRRMMELYKEHGTSPILGCLPMLLQMPIWIALYSAINAGIELRDQAWLPIWITDLSAPDSLFTFATITIPLVGWTINSFNLLPVLLAFGMYLQQKLTPTTSPQMAASPQMQQQQKMMLVMMPVMMLLVLYKQPSGLNLYIMASTFGGIIEQYVIRKHIREREAAEASTMVEVTSKTGGKTKKKKPKPFFKNG